MFNFFGFTWPDTAELINALPVIFSLIVIEGLLSVDNALAIAAMASHLPPRQRILALRLGILGAYVFRGLALFAAAWILETPSVMWIGAAYLLYLMSDHFTGADDEAADGKKDGTKARGLFATIMAIEIMDLSLSVDNVVAAAALDRRLWVVLTGVFIGILALRFVAGACIKLIVKFPILEHAAFLLIGFVGFILVGELVVDAYRGDGSHCHLHSGWKFLGISLILALSIWYSNSPAVQRVLRPLIHITRFPMRILASLVGGILQLVIWPFKLLFRLWHRPTA